MLKGRVTGSVTQRSAASLVLFDKDKKVIWVICLPGDLRAIALDPVSLQAPDGNGDFAADRLVADTRGDLDAVPTEVAAIMNATEGEIERDLEEVLTSSLPARERAVLVKRLGLFGSRVHTLEELAVELHMPPPARAHARSAGDEAAADPFRSCPSHDSLVRGGRAAEALGRSRGSSLRVSE